MLLAFFILNYSYLNKILAVEPIPAKEQTALCGIVDAYNRRNVKKNCTTVQFFSFYERMA